MSRSGFKCVRARNIDAIFVMLGLDCYGFYKKCIGTRSAELVFLNPVGSVCHVVHSSASGAQNIEALFVTLEWHRYGF
jgi:hypothetical protein